MLLECDTVTKPFGGLLALDGFSTTISEDTITGLIGPNGAGKTTFSSAITGIYHPDDDETPPTTRAIVPLRMAR